MTGPTRDIQKEKAWIARFLPDCYNHPALDSIATARADGWYVDRAAMTDIQENSLLVSGRASTHLGLGIGFGALRYFRARASKFGFVILAYSASPFFKDDNDN